MQSFKQFIKENLGQPQIPGQPQAQPQPQVPGQPQVNSRQAFMVRLVNQVLGSKIPETDQGYNQLGRSQGIVNELATPHGWARLKNSPVGDNLWNSIPQNVKIQTLNNFIAQQSR